jgi:hypothetical protein
MNSALLLDEPLLTYQPALVRRFGLAEAAIIQQLHFWMRHATVEHAGHKWVYKTYSEWSDEIGVTAEIARRTCAKLRNLEVLVAIQNPRDPRDRTLWWRINYEATDPPADLASPSGDIARPNGETASPSGGFASSCAGVQLAVQRLPTETTDKEPSSDKSDIRLVFDRWLLETKRTGATRLSDKRTRLIRNALRDYGLQDILDAVTGWRYSPYHCGENQQGAVYNDIELLLRDAARIEKFRDLARNPPLRPQMNQHQDGPQRNGRYSTGAIIRMCNQKDERTTAIDVHAVPIATTVPERNQLT